MNKEILAPFADNETLVNAVKEAIDEHFDMSIQRLSAYSNWTHESMGEYVRAHLVAHDILDKAFAAIKTCKTLQVTAPGVNPAR